MVEETESLVLLLLRDIQKEQAEQRSVLLGAVDHIRRLDDDMRRLEQRLEARLTAVRDDLELMLKSELLGRLTHFETLIDESWNSCRIASRPSKPDRREPVGASEAVEK